MHFHPAAAQSLACPPHRPVVACLIGHLTQVSALAVCQAYNCNAPGSFPNLHCLNDLGSHGVISLLSLGALLARKHSALQVSCVVLFLALRKERKAQIPQHRTQMDLLRQMAGTTGPACHCLQAKSTVRLHTPQRRHDLMKATDFLCCALRFHLGFFAGSFLGSLVFGRVLFQPVRSYVLVAATMQFQLVHRSHCQSS